MSTFRTLDPADIEQVRCLAGADAVSGVVAIASGIENSNWFVTLHHGDARFACVLTLVEAIPEDELPFFIALTGALAEADLPVPMPLRLTNGTHQLLLQGRPALLVPRLPGAHVNVAAPALCCHVGIMLARLHEAGTRCVMERDRPDHRWWPTAFAWLAPSLPADVHDALAGALLDATRCFAQAHALPHGIIHGDLFRDNVLATGDEVTGVLDFFHATRDVLAWDIAIALNDWAVVDGTPDKERADAVLAGYESVRQLTTGEHNLLPALRRAAAARFWLSRLVAAEQARERGDNGGMVSRKDPDAMRALWALL